MATDESIQTDRAPKPVGAYPHARRVGDLLFLSGIGPRPAGGGPIPGVKFDADGFGLSLRFKTSENTSVRLRGMKYEYSVPFRPVENVDAARLISVTRLSLVNSLVDHRAGVSLSIDQGLSNWDIDLSTWENILDRSRTRSLTVRYLFPMSDQTDLELGVGYDDSELYGDVTFFSLYLFFYGN